MFPNKHKAMLLNLMQVVLQLPPVQIASISQFQTNLEINSALYLVSNSLVVQFVICISCVIKHVHFKKFSSFHPVPPFFLLTTENVLPLSPASCSYTHLSQASHNSHSSGFLSIHPTVRRNICSFSHAVDSESHKAVDKE